MKRRTGEGLRSLIKGANQESAPIAVEVFRGNTSDVTTVPSQIWKMAQRFGVSEITFVGDRGMVKKIPISHRKR